MGGEREARGVVERRTRGGEMLLMLAGVWRASVLRGEEAGRFREVAGVSIVAAGGPRSRRQFNSTVNDISTVPLSAGSMLLYADDSMLYHPISAPEDNHDLQGDMNRLCTWTNDNLLKYNANKCKYMVISRKKQPLIPCTPLRVNQIAMEAVGSYKYLVVWLRSSLDWSEQIASVCKKARQQISIIYRRFYGHLNSWALRQMYLSYVRPHLEYAVPVWDPHHLGHIEALEKVQRFALKMCTKS